MEQYKDEIQLKDILIKLSEYKAYLFGKRFTIIAVSLLLFVFGIIHAFSSDTKYTAELTFVVEDQQQGSGALGAMSGMASQFGFDIGGSSSSTFSQNNILEFLKSRGVVEAALMQNREINKKDDLLIEHYLHLNMIKDSWKKNKDLNPVSFHGILSQHNDSVSGGIWMSIIEDKLSVELQSDESNIINLSYTSLNEEFAKTFVEALIEEMSKMYITHQTAQTNNTLDFLTFRSDSVFITFDVISEMIPDKEWYNSEDYTDLLKELPMVVFKIETKEFAPLKTWAFIHSDIPDNLHAEELQRSLQRILEEHPDYLAVIRRNNWPINYNRARQYISDRIQFKELTFDERKDIENHDIDIGVEISGDEYNLYTLTLFAISPGQQEGGVSTKLSGIHFTDIKKKFEPLVESFIND